MSNLPDSLSHLLINAENTIALDYFRNGKNQDNLLGQVDLCYIDPPYNTGNSPTTGFVYNDSMKQEALAIGVNHHKYWLSFMERRMEPVVPLLKDTGIIIVSIDDSEVHRLRVLMDKIFGECNFIAQVIVDGGNPKNNARLFSVTHEYMLVYAKNKAALLKSGIKWRKYREGIDLVLDEYNKKKKSFGTDYEAFTAHMKAWMKGKPLSKRLKVFFNVDARGLYTYADLSTPGKGPRYDVLHPLTGLPCQVPARGWGMSEEKIQALIDEDRVIFGADHTYQPLKKLYLEKKKDQVQKAILDYPSRSSTHLLEKVLGKRSAFNNPKNLDMMTDLIAMVCPSGGTVLDYFAGSGTTGHATVLANKIDGGSRRFVLVTNNENNIFNDVTLPRIQFALATETDNLNVLTLEQRITTE